MRKHFLNAGWSSSSRWLLASALGVCGLSGCAAQGTDEENVSTIGQAVKEAAAPAAIVASGCGYELATGSYSSWPGGYQAWVQLNNRTGAVGTSFEVLLDVGKTSITQLSLAEYQQVEGGYRVTEPSWLKYQQIKTGEAYRFQFNGAGAYPTVQPYLISVNGQKCDTEAPAINLAASASFLTANGTLSLTATATDNVAVRKVVFTQDGQVISVDTEAPFTAQVDVTAALNGRHTYAAKAYDPSGNETTSNSARLFVAIDNKFFGTAVDGAADYVHLDGFDQLSPGNAGKWGVVEATRDQMNWTELDTLYAYARANGKRFKMHTLVWGQQQPAWLSSLSLVEQREEIEEWFAAVAERYPDLEMIDVVNEPLHAAPAYQDALGGAGATGWDWLITSFELARKYFPKAELILNDYNILVMQQFTSDYLTLINLLKDHGLIDGIGEQGHFLERAELPVVSQNLDALAATGLPLYITELDVNFANDARQAARVRDLFTMFWNNPSVVGVTHWGYLEGHMWRPDAYLLRTDGTNRPALDWINCFLSGGAECPVPEYVAQPRVGDAAGITLQAEEYDAGSGVLALGDIVAYTDNGDWESFDRVQFQNTWDTIAVRYAKGNADVSSVSIHLDSLDAAPVITVPLPQTAGWGTLATQSIKLPSAITGEHTVFVKYNGGFGVGNVDSLAFSSSTLGPNIITNGDFESNTSGWFTWSGTMGTTTQSAQTGTHALIVSNRPGNGPAATTITSAVVPGTSYQVSFWVSIANAASANVNLTQKIRCSGGSDQYSWLANPVAVQQGQWVELKGTLAVPNCTLSEVTIYAEGPGAGIDLLVDNVSARAPVTQNLIPDGTFESSVGSWFSWNGTLSTTTTLAHGGSRSLVSTNRTGNGPVARSLMGIVEAGKTYNVSLWVSIANAASANVNLTRKFSCQGESDSYSWVVNPTAVTSGSWVKLSGTMAVPSCTLTDALIYAEGPGAGVDVYVDDVTLSQ